MRSLTAISSLLSTVLLFNSFSLAFETDQFNLPKVPLADIGDEVSEYIIENLRAAVESVNADIEKSEACLAARTKGCDSPEKEREKLKKLRSDEAVADAFGGFGDFLARKNLAGLDRSQALELGFGQQQLARQLDRRNREFLTLADIDRDVDIALVG